MISCICSLCQRRPIGNEGLFHSLFHMILTLFGAELRTGSSTCCYHWAAIGKKRISCERGVCYQWAASSKKSIYNCILIRQRFEPQFRLDFCSKMKKFENLFIGFTSRNYFFDEKDFRRKKFSTKKIFDENIFRPRKLSTWGFRRKKFSTKKFFDEKNRCQNRTCPDRGRRRTASIRTEGVTES